ncbi:hypothetical protein TrLO_g15891 [Triparma laevis f. longispina]|uniref:Uncharacterized protein n=1 Tax=Triparma laevis f. longispina TaxID=1714387 RepID=A0A9W6ZZJ1_9STRA|nr:hypothetical protein TrLO_g15891 [Triparma laevis f. longispina]
MASPLSPSPDINVPIASIALIVLLASLCITFSTTLHTFSCHFGNWTSPRLQRLALRITLLPLVYSVTFLLASVEPCLINAAEVLNSFFECYCLYVLFSYMTLSLSVSMCRSELGNYISRLELDELMSGGALGGVGVRDGNDDKGYNNNITNKLANDSGYGGNNKSNNEYSYIEVEESVVNSADDVDKTWAGYYGSFHGSFNNNDVSSIHNNNKSSTSEGVTGLIKSNCSTCWAKLRVRMSKAIFGDTAKKQFSNIRLFVLQAVYLKPTLLAISSYFKDYTDYVILSKIFRVSACLTLVVSMISLLYYYNVLRHVLKDIHGGRSSVGAQIFLVKIIVFALALQYIVIEGGLETTENWFDETFDYRVYSDTDRR